MRASRASWYVACGVVACARASELTRDLGRVALVRPSERGVPLMDPVGKDEKDVVLASLAPSFRQDDMVSEDGDGVSQEQRECIEDTLKSRSFHGTTTVAFRFARGVVCCVDSRASLGSFVGSYATEKAIPVSAGTLGTMAGSAGDCTSWLRLLSALSKLRELERGRPLSAEGGSRLLSSQLRRQPEGLGLSLGTMIFDHDTLRYVDSDGHRLKGDLFAVGSGSPYAYSVLDAGYAWDMTLPQAQALAEHAVRTAAKFDAYSGGFVNAYFADAETGTWSRLRRHDSEGADPNDAPAALEPPCPASLAPDLARPPGRGPGR